MGDSSGVFRERALNARSTTDHVRPVDSRLLKHGLTVAVACIGGSLGFLFVLGVSALVMIRGA